MLCDKSPSAGDNYNGCCKSQAGRWILPGSSEARLSPTNREPDWRSGNGLGPPSFMHIYDWWCLGEKGGTPVQWCMLPLGGQGTFKLPSWLCSPPSSPVPHLGAGSSTQGGERKPIFGRPPPPVSAVCVQGGPAGSPQALKPWSQGPL